MSWRPIPLDSGPDLPQVRKLGVGVMAEMTNVAFLVLSYLLNLGDPILGVWLEMGCAGILPRRHDQDAGRRSQISQVGVHAVEVKLYSSPTENSCSLLSISVTASGCESGDATGMSNEISFTYGTFERL